MPRGNTLEIKGLHKKNKYGQHGKGKRSMLENDIQPSYNIIIQKMPGYRQGGFCMKQYLYFNKQCKYEENNYSKRTIVSE